MMMTEFEESVDGDIVAWAMEHPEYLKDCKSKEEIAAAFWQYKLENKVWARTKYR
tara:strand:+ start:268 stop:432 length:165 start_codon:yes stop_codon:yes gene_type:complete